MTDRRQVLAVLAAGAAGIPASALGKSPTTPSQSAQNPPEASCCGGPGSGEHYFPNVTVLTHQGHRALFYSDLLQGKLVLVNFMSVNNDLKYPVSANLAKVQQLLGDRMGRDVFMYSITDDPDHDTPEVLSEFAEKIGAGPGWMFLTGDADALELIKGRFHVRRAGGDQPNDQHDGPHGAHHGQPHHGQHGAAHDCSLGLVRYGNVAVGLWGSVAAKADPKLIAERVAWVTPRPATVGLPKRGGPPPLKRRTNPLANVQQAEQDS